MIRKIITIIALASCFHTTLPMLMKSGKELTKYNQEQDTLQLFAFVENSPKRVQNTILDNLGVESKSDYDKALRIGANPRSCDVQTLGFIFDLMPASRDVLDTTNTHFDSPGKRKIDLTRDQYNALAAVPFIIRKNYYDNQGRFLKAVVQADLYTQLMRITASTAIGAVGGAFVGGTYAAGFSYGENLQQSHTDNLEVMKQQVTIFNQKYHDTYGPTFKETYAETVREEAAANNTVTTEIVKNLQFEQDAQQNTGYKGSMDDPMGREIFQGAGQLVNTQRDYQEQMKHNPEYVKEQALINRTVDMETGGQSIITEETATFGIGTLGSFVQGIFKNSFHKHHEAAIEYGVQAAASAALSAALSAVQAIGAPIINSDVSWDDVKDSAKTGGIFGGLGGFAYGMWNRNEPIKKKDIAKMNKPI